MPEVPQKPVLLRDRQGAPPRGRVGPQGVNHGVPAGAGACRPPQLRLHEAQGLGAADRHRFPEGWIRVGKPAVLGRQLAVRGYGHYFALVPAVPEAAHHVHHREAGADEQYPIVFVQAGEGIAAPGVPHVPGVASQGILQHGECRGREITEGQHGPVTAQGLPVRQFNHQPRFRLAQVYGLAIEYLQASWMTGLGFGKGIADVPGVHGPGGKAGSIEGQAAALQPADEVVGVVGEKAHLAGRYVEQVALLAGAVGDALPHAGRPLQQVDFQRRRPVLQQQLDG
jgi:hypothetical protein